MWSRDTYIHISRVMPQEQRKNFHIEAGRPQHTSCAICDGCAVRAARMETSDRDADSILFDGGRHFDREVSSASLEEISRNPKKYRKMSQGTKIKISLRVNGLSTDSLSSLKIFQKNFPNKDLFSSIQNISPRQMKTKRFPNPSF